MRTLRFVPTVAFLGLAMLLAGCVGASASGAIFGIVLLVSALGLQACLGSEDPAADTSDCANPPPCGGPCGTSCNYWPDTDTSDTSDTVDALDDGDCVELTPCGGPCGTSCNYWPDTETADATDAETTTCDGTLESACEEGVIVELCCPAGMACNYGETSVDCGDGTCVNQPDTCKPVCDGIWERACENGAVVELCCPAGLACNYGQLMVDCGDGTCVNQPETCPAER